MKIRLIKIADKLDRLGLHKLAEELDELIIGEDDRFVSYDDSEFSFDEIRERITDEPGLSEMEDDTTILALKKLKEIVYDLSAVSEFDPEVKEKTITDASKKIHMIIMYLNEDRGYDNFSFKLMEAIRPLVAVMFRFTNMHIEDFERKYGNIDEVLKEKTKTISDAVDSFIRGLERYGRNEMKTKTRSKLVKIADKLDRLGLYKLAEDLDKLAGVFDQHPKAPTTRELHDLDERGGDFDIGPAGAGAGDDPRRMYREVSKAAYALLKGLEIFKSDIDDGWEAVDEEFLKMEEIMTKIDETFDEDSKYRALHNLFTREVSDAHTSFDNLCYSWSRGDEMLDYKKMFPFYEDELRKEIKALIRLIDWYL